MSNYKHVTQISWASIFSPAKMKQVGKVPPKDSLSLSIAFYDSTMPPIPLSFPFISLVHSPLAAQRKPNLLSLVTFFSNLRLLHEFSLLVPFFPVDGSIQFCFQVVLLSLAYRNLASLPFCKACVLFFLRGDHRRGNQGRN